MTTTSRPKARKRRYDGPTAEEKLCAFLVEMLEKGVNPWRKEWKAGGIRGHINLVTGQPYRGQNPALLECYQQAKGQPLSLWAGGAQAKAKGWRPIKGSKAAYIVRPQANRFEDEAENVKTGEVETVERAWISYKPCAVFNVADLCGVDEKAQAELDAAILRIQGLSVDDPEPVRLQRAEDALRVWPVETVWKGDRAFYQPSIDQITMPERQLFKSAEALYATWAHETVHSTGHESRLKRTAGMASRFGSQAYAREELVAELGAFLVCNRLQISSCSENHAAYLKHWIEVLKEGPKVLFKVLSEATKAANLILGKEVEE